MCREIVDSEGTNNHASPSVIAVQEPKKTLKLTIDTFDGDNILVNQKKDTVLKTVRSWLSKGKMPTKDEKYSNEKTYSATLISLKNYSLTKKYN